MKIKTPRELECYETGYREGLALAAIKIKEYSAGLDRMIALPGLRHEERLACADKVCAAMTCASLVTLVASGRIYVELPEQP